MRRTAGGAVARGLLAAVLLFPLALAAAVPPQPDRWVTDGPRFLSEGARRALDAQLEAYQRQSGHHVLVWIGRTSDGETIEEFAVRAFQAWRVGRTGLDDGIVLFVFSEQRQLRIEVGYGLEGQVPDAIASRIIRETITPLLQSGNPDAAIQGGVNAILSAIEGRPIDQPPGALTDQPSGSPPGARAPPSTAQIVIVLIIGVAFLILFITNPALALHLLFTILSSGGSSSGRGGGYSGGGGGYSGGGGRSGGGGASGSW